MIVCLCRNVPEAAVARAIRAGAGTVADVSRATGAGTGCGCCRGTIAGMLARAPCATPPCPGCPRGRPAPREAR